MNGSGMADIHRMPDMPNTAQNLMFSSSLSLESLPSNPLE
jgi:hypothetical protein